MDETQVLLFAGPLVEELFELIILFLHESNSLFVLLDHIRKLFLHFLSPFDLLVHHTLDLALLLSFELFLSKSLDAYL